MSFYSDFILILTLNLLGSSFAKDSFIPKQNITNYNAVLPLNRCFVIGTNSGIFKAHNLTHIEKRLYADSTDCNEDHFHSGVFIEGDYTDFNYMVNTNLFYKSVSHEEGCKNPFQYDFFKTSGCYQFGTKEDEFEYYEVQPNYMAEYGFTYHNQDEICDIYKNNAKVAFYANKACYLVAGYYTEAVINVDKVQSLCENASDPVAIMLVFFFLVLVLF